MKKIITVIVCLVFALNLVACNNGSKDSLSNKSEQIDSASDEKDIEDSQDSSNAEDIVTISNVYSIGGKEFEFPRTMGELIEQIKSAPGVAQVIVRDPNSNSTYFDSNDPTSTATLEPEERIRDVQLWICTEEIPDVNSGETFQKAIVEFVNNSNEIAPMTEAKLANVNFFYQPESYQHMDFHLDNIAVYGGMRLDGTFTLEELKEMFPSVEEEREGKTYELKTENIHFYLYVKDNIVESVHCYFY